MKTKTDDELLDDFFDDSDALPIIRNPFKKLDDRLGIPSGDTRLPTTKKDVKEIKKAIDDGIVETKELMNDEAFEDKEFLRVELKSVIDRLKNQLDVIEQSALIGAEPRVFETYATMAKTLLDAIGKLADLQKQVSATIANNAIVNGTSSAKIVMEEKVTRKISASSFNDLLSECKKDVGIED